MQRLTLVTALLTLTALLVGQVAAAPPLPWGDLGLAASLPYATFLGGNDDDTGAALTVDASGTAYVAGVTLSPDFPTRPDAWQPTFGGAYDAFVARLNSDGSDLMYSTFLGGSGGDGARAIAVDASGAAYIVGYTNSADFPISAGAYQTTARGGWEVFVAKLDVGGRLVYATYLGGSDDDVGFSIALDASEAVYVTGYSFSSDFPTTPGAFQGTRGGLYDAFVAKLSADGSTLHYGTYLGGSHPDQGNDIAVDGQGAAYVTGITQSENFPTSLGAVQPQFGGGMCGSLPCADTFVTKLNATGSALTYSTYLGGGADDGGHAIALDGSGAAYVTGYANSGDFPTTPDAFQPAHESSSLTDAFATKLNASGNALAYSTFLGGSMWDVAQDITVDRSGAAVITGETWSSDFPTTPEATQPVCGGCPDASDAFVTTLNATGSELGYSTFLGGSERDPGYGIALDMRGAAYVTGSTFSLDFPTTAGAFQTAFGGGYHDAFVAKLTLGATPHHVYLPISMSSH